MISDHINQELLTLKEKKNYRSLPTPHPRRAECNSERATDGEPVFQ